MTDVAERLKAFEREPYATYPRDELRVGCLALYNKEKEEGTELMAIIGVLRDYVEREEKRLDDEVQQQYRQQLEEDRAAKEQRLMSGADCNWTQLRNSKHFYCRANGRTYRLSPTQDKMWHLHRVQSVSDDEKTPILGKYRGRADATRAVAQLAYRPEVR